jgi:hypothetical protein
LGFWESQGPTGKQRGVILRKRYKPPQNVTKSPPSGELDDEELISEIRQLPWETSQEYGKFKRWLFLGPGRSVRRAYRAWCEASGIEPKKNPPSTWYEMYRGHYAAFRKADEQYAAIEHAGDVHGRFPDWETLERSIEQEGELEQYKGVEFYEIMLSLALVDWAFHSLAIDNNGDPLPGVPTWGERAAAYWDAVAHGEVEPDPA